ncbi:MAG: rhomboid family intramembrane serine protease [Proteobacteria bacterium]|nr:rhomboid family intramembrane serine protease [Pseudomonadota bacterium]
MSRRSIPPIPHRSPSRALVRRLLPVRVPEEGRPSLLRRVFSPRWVNLVPEVDGRASLGRVELLDWELVLQARHLPCRTRRVGDMEWMLLVQPWFLDRAAEEMRLYQAENQPVPTPPMLPPPRPGELWPTVFLMLLLLAFHAWYTSPHPGIGVYAQDWLKSGSAQSEAILSGEWWRLITALTLHADGPHVVGNAVIGGTFIVLACRVLGNGLAWFLVMASGVGGNYCNALFHGASHDSIGFSTAVFGAAGVLAGARVAEGRGAGIRRAVIPVGAGLGILAMLGMGGGNTDLGAHIFGFMAGLGLGFPAGFLAVRQGRPPRLVAGLLFATALAAPILGWWLAF